MGGLSPMTSRAGSKASSRAMGRSPSGRPRLASLATGRLSPAALGLSASRPVQQIGRWNLGQQVNRRVRIKNVYACCTSTQLSVVSR